MHSFSSREHTTTSWGRSKKTKVAIKVCYIYFPQRKVHKASRAIILVGMRSVFDDTKLIYFLIFLFKAERQSRIIPINRRV